VLTTVGAAVVHREVSTLAQATMDHLLKNLQLGNGSIRLGNLQRDVEENFYIFGGVLPWVCLAFLILRQKKDVLVWQ